MQKERNLKLLFIILFLLVGIAGIILDYIFLDILLKWINYIIVFFSSIFIFVGLLFLYSFTKKDRKKMSIKQMSMVGIQSAITVILYYFVKINVPFFPPWLDIQVSEIPALITGFAYGPFAGSLVILVRFLLKLPATMTAGVGEAADLLLGLSLILTSSIIYKKHRNLKGAFVGTLIGVIFSIILACILNWIMLIPAYIFIAGLKEEQLISLLNYMPFEVTKQNFMISYIFVGVLPFNITRYILVFVLTFILYKKIHMLLDKITNKKI